MGLSSWQGLASTFCRSTGTLASGIQSSGWHAMPNTSAAQTTSSPQAVCLEIKPSWHLGNKVPTYAGKTLRVATFLSMAVKCGVMARSDNACAQGHSSTRCELIAILA
eukprot:2161854-Amphidinium_carterae.1